MVGMRMACPDLICGLIPAWAFVFLLYRTRLMRLRTGRTASRESCEWWQQEMKGREGGRRREGGVGQGRAAQKS
jgi:hypothetical protein